MHQYFQSVVSESSELMLGIDGIGGSHFRPGEVFVRRLRGKISLFSAK